MNPSDTSASVAPREGIFAHWPNRITAVRFLGSIVLFALLSIWGETVPGMPVLMLVVFWLYIGIACSDFLDGYLARRGNVVTPFGRIADPFTDKVMVIGIMMFLATLDWSRHYFPVWFVVIVLAREFLVTGIRGYVESLGMEFSADWFGKIKMIIQCILIGIALGLPAFDWPQILRDFLEVSGYVFLWGTLITSLGSGMSYVLKTRRLLGGGPA